MKTQSNHLFKVLALLIFVFLALLPVASNATASTSIEPDAPLTTAFTFQGQIRQDGLPVSSLCDFIFELYSVESGFVLPIDSFPTPNIEVTNGYFTQPIDFDVAHFLTGEERWLQVETRCPAGSGNYTLLSPRQRLFPTPFSNYSRGIWNFGDKGSIETGTPLDSGPGWMMYAANGNRRDIVAGVNGISLLASSTGAPANQNQFVVTENGNTGIGTETPAQRLHVVGNRIRLQGNNKILDLRTDGTQVDIESTTNSVVISSSGTGHHVVMNPGSGTGNVGIGTFTPDDGKLEIATTSGDAVRIARAGDDGIQIGYDVNFPEYGLYIDSPGTENSAVVVSTRNLNGEWGVFTNDKIYAANVTMNAVTLIAVVADEFELRAGDVASAIGFTEHQLEDTKPLALVAPVARGRKGIVGVVEGRMELLPESEKVGQDSSSDATFFSALRVAPGPPIPDGQDSHPLVLHRSSGPAKAGDYVAITIAGLAQVRVDTLAGPIEAGQRLTSADQAGLVRAQRTISIDGIELAEAAPVIGVALETQQPGQELVWMYVNPQ